MDGIDQEINSCESAGQERTPLPVIVLSTQVEVAEENGGLRAGDDQDDKDQEEKAKHVVHLVRPDAVENEKQLDEDASEWQDSSHDNARKRFSIEGLLWNLSWNLVGPHRMFNGAFLETEVRSDKGEGH